MTKPNEKMKYVQVVIFIIAVIRYLSIYYRAQCSIFKAEYFRVFS